MLVVGLGLCAVCVGRAARAAADADGTSAVQPGPPTPQLKRITCPLDGLSTATLPAAAREIVVAVKKKAWEDSLGGRAAAKPHIQARLVGWPQHVLIDRGSLPKTDREFALRLARDTWRGLDALSDRENGLPIDNARFAKNSVGLAEARIGDYTSGTNIGLHLIAIVAARELGFLPAAAAVEKIGRVLDTLEHLETYRGFFFNFYDTTSLERTSNFVSFVDSAWLTAGLIVVRNTFPDLAERCTQVIAKMDFSFFYNGVTGQVSHGYYVKPGIRSPYDYGMLYTEARLGSLIAIGKGDVPEAHWATLARTFPADCAGQTLLPQGTRIKTLRGHELAAGYYEWGGLRYVPSWGGSMFEALMPTLVLDEVRHAPKSLGLNDRAHAEVQRRYALEQLGYRVWGLSPCATPAGDSYGEYGVKVLGARGYDGGAVTPHASALALGFTPEAALTNLRQLAQQYDVYGEYGFYDAADPRSGAVAYKYLALDQSMVFIALANYLNDHCIQKHFGADPIAQKALALIGDEDFFD